MKKWRLSLIFLAIILLVLALTNPDQQRYEDWQTHRWSEHLNVTGSDENDVIGAYIFENNTSEKDLWFFSIFTTRFSSKHLSYLGVLGTFIPLQSDDFYED